MRPQGARDPLKDAFLRHQLRFPGEILGLKGRDVIGPGNECKHVVAHGSFPWLDLNDLTRNYIWQENFKKLFFCCKSRNDFFGRIEIAANGFAFLFLIRSHAIFFFIVKLGTHKIVNQNRLI